MNKKIALSFCLLSSLIANETDLDPTKNLDPTKEESTIFFQKYNEKSLKEFQFNNEIKDNQNKIDNSTAEKITTQYQDTYKNKDENIKKYDLKTNFKSAKAYEDISKEMLQTNQEKYKIKDQIKLMKDNILYDKDYSFAGKTLLNQIIDYQGRLYQLNHPSKEILNEDEIVYVVLSSSLPRQTLINYLQSINQHRQDFKFIFQGFVGNKASLMATYVKNLIQEATKGVETSNYNITVNPKIIQALNIKEAPAVVFLQNYNGYLEQNDNVSSLNSSTKAYVFNGDMPLEYALEQINKQAKSQSLDNLISTLKGENDDK